MEMSDSEGVIGIRVKARDVHLNFGWITTPSATYTTSVLFRIAPCQSASVHVGAVFKK